MQKTKVSNPMKSELKNLINEEKSKINRALNAWRNEVTRRRLNQLRPYDTKLYHNINKITSSRQTIPPLQMVTGMAYHSADKVQVIADNFESVHQQNLELGNPEHNLHIFETVDTDLLNLENQTFQILETPTTNEIQTAIKDTRKKKAPGDDGARNKFTAEEYYRKSFFLSNEYIHCNVSIWHIP